MKLKFEEKLINIYTYKLLEQRKNDSFLTVFDEINLTLFAVP